MTAQQPPPDRDPIATSVGDRGARITPSEIALMLVAAVRLPVVALQAERIQTSYFDPRTEAHLIMFWRAASAAAKDHGGVLPADPGQAREIVGARCTREIANDPTGDFYTRQVQQQVLGQGGLLDEAFAMPIGRAIEDEAIELLIRFLTERATFEPLRRALLGLGPNDVPRNLGALAGELTRHANELAGLGSDAGSDAIVEGDDFRPPGATTFTTGETWLDRIMDGGQAGHETYALLGATGAGKCFAKGTRVLMFDGSTKAVEDVVVGDRVMGPDSGPRTVLSLGRGREEMYRVTGADGSGYTVNASHVLTVKLTPRRRGQTHRVVNLPVTDYLKASTTFRHMAKGYRAAVDFPTRPVPVDPYFLGIWLADGSADGPSVTKPDAEIGVEMRRVAAQWGMQVSDHAGDGHCAVWAITTGYVGGRNDKNPLLNTMRAMGVTGNKHVPDVYLYNDRNTRLEVLAGLLDGDGDLNHDGVCMSFSSTSEALADAVVFLARSLGLAANKAARITTCQTGAVCHSFRVGLSGHCAGIPCRVPRKKAEPRRQIKDVSVYGLTVTPAGVDDYYGFAVDGDHLFLLSDLTVVHNSSLGVQIALNCAKAQAALAAEIGTDRAGHWYYFTYELTRDQVRERVYAYGAKVDRKSLNDKMVPLSTSARPETIKEYEHELIVNSPKNPLRGERERIAALGREGGGSRSHFHIVDYSGHHPGQGVGGVEEVAAYLSRERAKGRRIGGVVIDYAGISISRYVAHRKLRPEAEYPLLNSYIDNVRTAVAIPFDCPSWVMHQLHGDFARKSAGAKVHHADAKGARNFADNADFAFGLPKYNEKTRLLTFWMTKSRRAAGMEDNVILRYEGRFSMFIEPGQEYVVDPFTGQIVPRDFAERLAPPAPRRSPVIDPRTGA